MSPSLCSDGAGRSGTYILIDMVLNRLAKGKDRWLATPRPPDRGSRGGGGTRPLEGDFSKAGDKEEADKEKAQRRKIKKNPISNYLFKAPY